MKPIIGMCAVLFCLSASAAGQAPSVQRNPIYKITINVVERNVKAVNYRVRGGATRVDFKGTALAPDGNGEAYVESKKGYVEVKAELRKFKPATSYGPEYLTYVLWAITPEGRATNLGELVLGNKDDHDARLEVTTELQSFGLIVTAEPYFAVTQPSDVVVMENIVRKDTEGTVEAIDAKFDLLKRGEYVAHAAPADLKAPMGDWKEPLDLAQARNAVRIASWAGAQANAADSWQKANMLLAQAETEHRKGEGKKTSTLARDAVQTAEDARLVTLKRLEETQLANERRAALDRELAANAKADQEARLRADADAARAQADAAQRIEIERRARAEVEERVARERADAARLEADLVRADANRAKAEAEARAAREAEARAAKEKDDTARLEIERARIEAENRAARERAEASRLDAERARADANRAAEEARRAAAQARDADLAARKAEQDKAELRANLVKQLNLILETRDSARGLIVNMSDVLFDTAQHTLKPGAREKLAKVSGILLAHPGLAMEVEGHTDSVGTDEYNRELSERRAAAVRDYFAQQGIPPSSITARGFGEGQPVATNDTADGRQRNRRVELVVSGEVIGIALSRTIR